ncbi:MAG: YciI family protein [Pseudomonadota bacterium]
MKVMVIVKASKESEAGLMPSEALLSAMGRYNEELVKAGVLLAGEGLHPTAKGVRIQFSDADRSVSAGPFGPAGQQIAGFWLFQVKSMDEAIDWVKRCPTPFQGQGEIEIRPVFEVEDFGDAFTPELREQEERIRAQAEGQK